MERINTVKEKMLNVIKKENELKDKKEKIEDNWLSLVMKSRKEHERKKKQEADARAARLRRLFVDDEGSEDDESVRGETFQGLGSMFDRVNAHLQMEKKLIDTWFDNDKE